MPQICDMGPTALLPLRRKARWGFSALKNPDGFGRVWTRELGYLKAARYPYTTETPAPVIDFEMVLFAHITDFEMVLFAHIIDF
jgi:hypothetical protein